MLDRAKFRGEVFGPKREENYIIGTSVFLFI
jgi:hypothetical protein